MSAAAVTVAIPVYNGVRFLAETIRSILAQSESAFRLVCVDDASTDHSVAIARGFDDPRLSVIVAERHGSLAQNWNRALWLVDTPYVVIAHQDDVYERDYLATMLPLIESRPSAFAAHCKTRAVDADGRAIRLASARFKETFWPANDPYERAPAAELAVLRRGNYVVASSVMMRVEAARQIGAFNETLQFVTDWDYWLRGVRAGFTLAGTHRRLVRFRRHEQTATRATEISLRRYEEELALLRANGAGSFRLVENTLTADFAARLAAGDRPGAAALLDFGAREIPGFGGTRLRVLRAAARAGAIGGRLLDAAGKAMVELSVARHRLRSG